MSSKTNIKISNSRLLLVEGKDEVNFFNALLERVGLNFQVLPVDGKSKFRSTLDLLRNDPRWSELTQLIAIRDADQGKDESFQIGEAAKGAFASLADSFRQFGVPVPSGHGAIARRDQLRSAIFIMPDGIRDGMLEESCDRFGGRGASHEVRRCLLHMCRFHADSNGEGAHSRLSFDPSAAGSARRRSRAEQGVVL
ncbi:MAG: DUF3226 domain-containing protein [Polyangiaceae bacterium]